LTLYLDEDQLNIGKSMTAEIIEKKNGSRRQADDMRNIALDRPSVVFLKLAPEKVARYERRGDDLVLVLKDGQEITIAGFFVKYADEASTGQTPAADTPAEAAHDRSELVLVDDNDVSWWGQYPDQWSEFHFAEIEWDDVAGFAWWPLALGALGAAAAGVAALSFGGGGKASHPPVAADDRRSRHRQCAEQRHGRRPAGRDQVHDRRTEL
jgi:hypothetical protein